MQQGLIPTANELLTSKQIRMQEQFALFLALIAGYVDAFGAIKWKTYVSFMSGNTTQLGAAFAKGNSQMISTSLTAVSCFLFGIYTGTCLSLWQRNGRKKLPIFIVSGILFCYAILSFNYTIYIALSIGIIAFSMGIMNTIVTTVGNQSVNTDFVTGTLNSLAKNTALLSMTTDKVEKKLHKSNIVHLLLLWMGFLLGAASSTFSFPFLGHWMLVLPASLLLVSSFFTRNLIVKH